MSLPYSPIPLEEVEAASVAHLQEEISAARRQNRDIRAQHEYMSSLQAHHREELTKTVENNRKILSNNPHFDTQLRTPPRVLPSSMVRKWRTNLGHRTPQHAVFHHYKYLCGLMCLFVNKEVFFFVLFTAMGRFHFLRKIFIWCTRKLTLSCLIRRYMVAICL
ncbi:unnamed protein product [Nippostrongylus brasiliensis]|uniref:Uncharacterized protein n=1 Tax=Nippostrongylus brasiliensis TaxID=27835 RepID=A0A0N4YZT1_NIPBR|nr:unnamed protein product [Nippostrongylus brasiliensis]